MTAVLEQPKPVQYRMPACNLGERVHYYTGADRNMAPQNGTIIEVGGCSVTIRVMQTFGDDVKRFDVCHVSDPRLNNHNIRVNGSWDFHPDTKLLKELAERVAALEVLAHPEEIPGTPENIIAGLKTDREKVSMTRSESQRAAWARRKAAKAEAQ